MRNVAQFSGCIVRWGGGGGAMLGALLYILWLSTVVVLDIARIGKLPSYDPIYVVIGLVAGALVGFVLGIFMAIVNGAVMGLLIASFRLRHKSANIQRKTLALTFTLVSGPVMLVYLILSDYQTTMKWFLWPAIPAILAACWAWLVGEKAPIMSLQR